MLFNDIAQALSSQHGSVLVMDSQSMVPNIRIRSRRQPDVPLKRVIRPRPFCASILLVEELVLG